MYTYRDSQYVHIYNRLAHTYTGRFLIILFFFQGIMNPNPMSSDVTLRRQVSHSPEVDNENEENDAYLEGYESTESGEELFTHIAS